MLEVISFIGQWSILAFIFGLPIWAAFKLKKNAKKYNSQKEIHHCCQKDNSDDGLLLLFLFPHLMKDGR